MKCKFNILPAIVLLTKLLLCSETPCLCQVYRLLDFLNISGVPEDRPERVSSSSNISDMYSGYCCPNFDQYYAYSFFFVVCLCTPRQFPVYILKLNHSFFLSHPFQFIICYLLTLVRYLG